MKKSINYALAVVHMAQKAGYKSLADFVLHELKDENITEVSSIGQHYLRKRLEDEDLIDCDLKWLTVSLDKFESGVYYFELFTSERCHAWVNIVTESEIWYAGIHEGSRNFVAEKFDKSIYAKNFSAMMNGSTEDYRLIFQPKGEIHSVEVKYLRFTKSGSYE